MIGGRVDTNEEGTLVSVLPRQVVFSGMFPHGLQAWSGHRLIVLT